MAIVFPIHRFGRFVITATSVSALLSSCVDVDGYRLRDDSDKPDASGGATDESGIGGIRFATSTTVTRGGNASTTPGGTSSTGGSIQRATTSQGGSAATGGSRASGQCEDATQLTCAEMKTSDACTRLPGCAYSAIGSCSSTKNLTCAELSYSVEACALLPGCTSTGEGKCVYDTPTCDPDPFYGVCSGAEDCPSVTSHYYCEAASNCRWKTVEGSCSGEPKPCASLLTSGACASSYNCAWKVGECTGTPTPCSLFTTASACASSDNCSWPVFL